MADREIPQDNIGFGNNYIQVFGYVYIQIL